MERAAQEAQRRRGQLVADDPADVQSTVDTAAVVLMAHNRHITYGYTGDVRDDTFYYDMKPGSIIVDPWRRLPLDMPGLTVIHYGNTRSN